MEDERMLPVPQVGMEVRTVGAQVATARKVEVRRSKKRVLDEITALAREAGESYYYELPFWDRKKGETTYVRGLNITGAMDVAREYGNCVLSCDDIVEETHAWFFHARFTDFETGFSIVRPYRQRRDQSTGMEKKDPGRHQDMLFQIGLSKALRNVIDRALPLYCRRAFEEAFNSKVAWIRDNPDKARQRIIDGVAGAGGDIKRVEQSISRVVKNWTVQDMAGIFGRLMAVYEEQCSFDDAFPVDDSEQEETKPAEKKKMAAAPDIKKKEAEKPVAQPTRADKKQEKAQEPSDAKKEQAQAPKPEKQEIENIPTDLDRRGETQEQEEESPDPEPEPEQDSGPKLDDGENWDEETGEVTSLNFGDD